MGFTEIGNNTLIDTLVQVAHNCKIGKNITITGGSNIEVVLKLRTTL